MTLMWENDDLQIEAIADELAQTFKDVFGFDIDAVTIPAEYVMDSHARLRQKLETFCKQYDSETTLFIVIYQGRSAFPCHGF